MPLLRSLPSVRTTLLLALVAAVLGGKFRLIERYGSDLPYWDQWDAEGDDLIRPLHEGRLKFMDLFAPHAEHRIFFTRVAALGLFLANQRQWDARLEMVANTGWHAALALLLAALAFRVLPPLGATAYAFVLAAFFSTPAAWDNVLGGFQSQFYFLLLFSALHLAGTLAGPPAWPRRLAASLAGAAALVSMGSGLLSAAAVVVVLGLKLLRDRRLSGMDLALLAANLALCAAGWLLRTEAPGNAWARVGNLSQWAGVAWYELEWPAGQWWMVLLNIAPALVLGAAWLRRRLSLPLAPLLLAAWTWYLLQTAALSYARGREEHIFYSYRYTDVRAIGVLVNLLAVGVLAAQVQGKRARAAALLVAAALAAAVTGSLQQLAAKAQGDFLARMPGINQARIDSVRRYLMHPDPAFFRRKPWDELPYPSADRLAQWLDQPGVRQALPASVRPPISWTIEPAPPGAGDFGGYPADAPPGAVPMDLAALYRPAHAPPSSDGRLLTGPFDTDHDIVSLFVAGGPGTRLRLALIDAGGVRHSPWTNVLVPPAAWQRVNFRVPAAAYRLEALTEGDGWAAVTQPFTDTALSRAAHKAAGSGPWLLGLSALLVGGAVARLVTDRTSRREFFAAHALS